MILYFSGTGNSLAIARNIAQSTNDRVMTLTEAVQQELTAEKRIGLVYPSYDFNMPPAVRLLLPQLKISADAYVFVIISCGAQAGNCIWTAKRLLRKQGVRLAYSHKVRVPDNSAIAFGRNPNNQIWKFERFAFRLERIIADVKVERHELHFNGWSFLGWLMGQTFLEKGMIRTLGPKVNTDKCIGCGICEKVCPINNIVVNEKADIGKHCTLCFGCVHFCPQQAITTNGREALKERQYHHPEITLKDMLQK